MNLKLLRQYPAGSFKASDVKVVVDAYTELAKTLSKKTGESNWGLVLTREDGNLVARFEAISDNPETFVRIERVFDFDRKVLTHELFTIGTNIQGSGIADEVAKASARIMDAYKWTKIRTAANLDVGGYAWLRKGFFPKLGRTDIENRFLSIASARIEGSRLYQKLAKRISGMTSADLRKFVLTDEFREYKDVFLGSSWDGEIDLSDPASRKAFLRGNTPIPTPIEEAKKPKAKRASRPPRASNELTQNTVRHQVMLERLKSAEAKDFNRILPILEKQVVDALAKLRGPITDMTRGQLNGMLRELRAAQQAALEKSQDGLLRRLRNIAAYESDFEAGSMSAAAPRGIAFSAATTEAAWASVTTVPLSATGDLLEPFVRDMTTREVSTINKVIMRGYSEGWTNDEITRVLRGTKKLGYKDGLLPAIGKHNATLVRTAVQHVSNQAREATWESNEITEYRWVSTLDGRTTSQCRTLDGKVFTIGKGPRPPIHMNCRSCTVAIIPGLENLSDMLTRASKDGQVGGSVTYYDWLKTQGQEFQDHVLGATRGKLFREGGLTAERFSQLQLGSSFQPLTLEQMQKLEPLAFRRAGIDTP